MESVIVQLAAPISAVLVAIIAAYATLKKKHSNVKQENKVLKIELSCINILFNHEFLKILNSKVENIFAETKIDRFLILFAVNGKDVVKYATVCYERNKATNHVGAIYRYIRLEVDTHYQNLLKQVEAIGTVHLVVKEMPTCMLKTIYQSREEEIKYSTVKFLKRIEVDQHNDIIVYSSIATSHDEDLTNEEHLIIKYNFDAIKSEAKHLSYQ
jgi:hypothetical protein